MRRPAMIGGIALALVAGSAIPAQADSPQPQQTMKGRFTHLSTTSIGKVTNLPASLRRDAVVNALVQLSTAPVAVQESTTGGASDGAAVRRQVLAEQASKDGALRAAGARVEGRLTQVLNAVRVRVKVEDLGKVAAISGVRAVQVAKPVRPANGAGGAYTGVGGAWQDVKATGAGTVIGIIDTGIDYTHADFGGPGTVAAFEAARKQAASKPPAEVFPTGKVIGGWDFVGDAYNAEDPDHDVPVPDPNPIPCQDHGTHVAGTAAGAGVTADGATYTGPYTSTTLPGDFRVAPGTAPQALLRAYKVFGCDGSVSDDIVVAAIDQAVADGVDVINMSLGSTFGSAGSLDSQAVDNATAAGVVVVASAGNEGPNAYMTGAPAAADTALAVAAMDASSPTFPGASITLPGGGGTLKGINANGASFTELNAAVMVAGGAGSLGCDPADYTGAKGKIVIAFRGTCARVDRAVFGQQAGAVAVIMVNNSAGLPPFEGVIDGVTIPFIGLDMSVPDALTSAATLTIAPSTIDNPGYTDFAHFSSAGPRRLDSALKPDISAPGVSVVSAGMGKGTGNTTMSGTSMASPHVAGIAALVRQTHPRWTPGQVKAALISTADPGKVGDFAASGGPVRGGTGLVQPRRAADAVAYASTRDGRDSLSFGLESVRPGEPQTRTFAITNTSRRPISYDLSVQLATPSYGASISVSPRRLRVPPRTSRSVTVRIRMSSSAIAGLPGVAASNNGELTRISGAVVATPRGAGAGVYPLRTAFLLVPRALSDVKARSSALHRRGSTSTGRLTLTNSGRHSGTADVYAWQLSDRARDTTDPEVPDIIDVGVQSQPGSAVGVPDTDRLLVFAVNSAAATSTHATQEIDVAIDTDGDGTRDFITFVADFGVVTTGSPDGSLGVFTFDVRDQANPTLVDLWGAYAPANTSIEELPVLASALGLGEGHGGFSFTVASYSILGGGDMDGTDVATFDAYHPVVSNGDYVEVARRGRASVGLSVDLARLKTQTTKGWLVVTGDDAPGRRTADRVALAPHHH